MILFAYQETTVWIPFSLYRQEESGVYVGGGDEVDFRYWKMNEFYL